MLTKATEVLAGDLGLNNVAFGGTRDERAYGIYRDYLLAVYDENGKRTAFFGCPFDTGEDNSVYVYEFTQALNETVSEFGKCACSVDSDGITVTLDSELKDFRSMIDSVVELLKANEVPNSRHCVICGKEFGDGKIMILNSDGMLRLVCEGCALSASLEHDKKSGSTATKKQRMLGCIGAVIGALIGAALFIGVAALAKILNGGGSISGYTYGFSVICFAVALITYLFSHLFCRTKDTAVTSAVFVMTFAADIAARVLVTAYQTIADKGIPLHNALRAFGSFIKLPFTAASGVNIVEVLIVDALFALVSLSIFALGLLKNTHKSIFSVEQYKD